MEDRAILTREAPPPDLTVRYGDHPDQLADIWPGESPDRPLLVLIHGGFWRPTIDRTHSRPMANALRADGWTVAAVEYRRTPGQPDDALADILAAVHTVSTRTPGTHSRASVLVGHSAGGHLALCAATTAPGIARVVALAAVTDLRRAHAQHLGDGAVEAFLGGHPEQRADLDPVRLPAPDAPVTLVQGDRDEIVPPEFVDHYLAAHPGADSVLVPGAGHFPLIDPLSVAWPAVLRAIAG